MCLVIVSIVRMSFGFVIGATTPCHVPFIFPLPHTMLFHDAYCSSSHGRGVFVRTRIAQTMFSSTTRGFTQSVSSPSQGGYHRIPDLVTANQCELLQIAIMTRRWLPFRRPKVDITDFKLKDLLTSSEGFEPPIDDPSVLVPAPGYKKTSNVDFHGKLKAELKSAFENELDNVVSINSAVDLGMVNLHSVDENGLIGALVGRKLNLNHPLVSQVRRLKRTSLCVVTGVALTEKEGSIHYKFNLGGKGMFTTEGVFKSWASIDASEEMNDLKERDLPLPANTPLAYEALELRISKKGTVELIVVPGVKGGWDAPDSAVNKVEMENELVKGLMARGDEDKLAETDAFRKLALDKEALLQVDAALDRIAAQYGISINNSNSEDGGKHADWDDDDDDDSDDDDTPLCDTARSYLTAVGLTVDEEGCHVTVPDRLIGSESLKAAMASVDALESCEAEVLKGLLALDSDGAASVEKRMKDCMNSEPRKDLEGESLAVMNALQVLGFNFSDGLFNVTEGGVEDDSVADAFLLLHAFF